MTRSIQLRVNPELVEGLNIMDKYKKNRELNRNENEKPEIVEEHKEKERERIQELEEKVKDFEEKWKRAVADYQNQEKWVREQRAEWIRSANKDLLLRILPILDTLIIAQQHSSDQSLQVSINQFTSILKEEGVVRIETAGKVFDPMLMEAISAEEGEENKIIRELRAGYMLHEKVLRPAQVIVGKGK